MPLPPDRHVRLAVGDVTVDVDLAEGARASSWTVGGVELLGDNGADPVQHGMYPMAPWAGRIRDNAFAWAGREHVLPVTYEPWALHGTALAREATVVASESAADNASVVARIGDHPGWPWPMTVDITWELQPRLLTTTITVVALDEPFPVVVGWHPWFRRSLGVGGSLEWSLPATTRLVRGDDHLPTGERVPYSAQDGPFDDAFHVPDGTADVRWPGALAIDIAHDADWFVVFDELNRFVCIEPQSGPPDGLGPLSGRPPAVAAPGSPHVHRTQWRMRDLPG